MSVFRRKGKGDPDDRPLPVLATPVIEAEAYEAPPEPSDDPDFIWRCRCGSMGTSRSSLITHVAEARRCEPDWIREYVPRPPASSSTEIGASGVWIVIQLPESTGEGELHGRYNKIEEMEAHIVEARTGLSAIQSFYKAGVDGLSRSSTEEERDRWNGRYVAIDFFTGHRAEALVTSKWMADVVIAEGSHT